MNYFKFCRIKSLIILVIGLSLFFSSCSNSNEGKITSREKKEINVDLEEKSTVYMSDLFEDIRYLNLENVEDHLIGNIQKILIRDEILFIFEKTTPSVFLYDLKGNYLNQVVITEGRGPEEMMYARDFAVNRKQNEIVVLGFQEIHRYSYKDKFLGRISIEIDPDRITLVPGGSYGLFMNNDLYSSEKIKSTGFNLLYLNTNGIIQKFLKIDKFKRDLSFGVSNNFPRYNGKQLFYSHPSYTIYELKPEKISARYTLDFGEYNVPSSLFRQRKNLTEGHKFIQKTIKREYASFLANFLETDPLIYFSIFWDRPRAYPVFYSKKENQLFVAEKLVNDIDGGLTPYFTTTYENELVAHIQPSDLLEKVEQFKKTTQTGLNPHQKKLLEFAGDLEPLDNPVIMFAEVKSRFKE